MAVLTDQPTCTTYIMRLDTRNIRIYTIFVILSWCAFLATTLFTQVSTECISRNWSKNVASKSYSHKAFISPVLNKPRDMSEMIRNAAIRYHVSPHEALAIAVCESNLRPDAKNPLSSAQGIYQFTTGTWEYTNMPGDRLDPVANIYAFMELYPKYPHWWECATKV